MHLSNPTISSIKKEIEKLKVASNEAACLIFGEKTLIDYEELVQELNTMDIDFLGAFFPQIIYGSQNYEEGVLLYKHETVAPTFIIKDIGTASAEKFLQNSDFGSLAKTPKATAFMLIDGVSPNVALFLNQLYNTLGNAVNYIGAGAGSLSLKQKPCLLTREGLLENAAVICFVNNSVELSVQHGWKKLHGPVVATKTDKNIIYELNWQNAFDVYQSIVNQDSPIPIQKDNFFDVATGYPFGITVEGKEDIVLDPLALGKNGELICVGDVDNNAVLNILKGIPDNLIDSAHQAANNAIEPINDLSHVFVVNCITRTFFLKDEFKKELEAITDKIKQKNSPLFPFGVLSLGEISSEENSPLYLYNKTIVIGAFSN